MTRVLLALDGTDLDTRIVDSARRVFGESAEYLALNVRHTAIPPVPLYVGMDAPFFDTGELVDEQRTGANDEAAVAAQAAAATVREAGLEAEAIGEIGNPAFTIPAVAEEHDVDVIVVGTHDRSWWSRLFEPSVAEGVMHQTEIPVLTIHTARG